MSYGTHNSQYLENEVISRSPEWLIPLLYEHLLANLNRASLEFETGHKAPAAESLNKGSRILFELLGSLDVDSGGEMAEGLASLYSFYASEIIHVTRTGDLERLGRLIEWAAELHESWVAAAEAVAPRNGAPGANRTMHAA
jgi:Flagellin-specific chaperone FliS